MTEATTRVDDDGRLWVHSQVRVIYGDTDAMGVVYYGCYMRYLEIGRCEFMRARGLAYSQVEASGFLIPVAEVNVRYRSPARYDDLIDVATAIKEHGRASVHFTYLLTHAADGRRIATGSSRHACITREGTVVRLPDELYQLLLDASPPV